MDLEVVGRHAMLFDDDGMAAFVNSAEALVEWNSLSIDRYDVRHLLSAPLPPRLKRRPPQAEPDLDHQRYLDLPSSSSDEEPQDNGSEPVTSAGFHAVAFSYGNSNVSMETKDNDTKSSFRPKFPVPESLLHNLPPNEKVHQIISRTAMFVSKHGSQSEIILRVKQGDNPTFGFLMPDHHLHAYFRFLIDHQELLKADKEDDSSIEDINKTQGIDQTGGALSLLGSVYGSGEDEDGTSENNCDFEKKECEGAVDAVSTYTSPGVEQAESCSDVAKKDGSISKNTIPSLKEKVPVIKRNHSISTVKTATTGRAKTGDGMDSMSNTQNKSQTSVPSTAAKIELPVVEPPSELKRAIEKIVEFILKNGKQFEAVLAEQDRPHGRFPFLLPSNRYHTYYLKVLQTVEQSKLKGKGHKKHNRAGRAGDNNSAVHDEGDNLSHESMASDLPNDMDRKEKFKMTIGKSKKDGQDPIPKDHAQNTVSMDAAATAAILQAATRGVKNPNMEFFGKPSSASGQGFGSEGGCISSSGTGSLYSSQPQGFVENPNLTAKAKASAPVAKAIAEKIAIAAAGEADSSEAHMTKEQKIKAERLKRAKMFAAMLKSGVGGELPRALSVEPLGSGLSGSDAETGNLVGKEREGSSVPFDVEKSDNSQNSEDKLSVGNSDRGQNSEEKLTADNNERRSNRKYRSRSNRHEEEEEVEKEEEEDQEDKRHHKRSGKRHRSSHNSRDRHKNKRRHLSSKDTHSYRGGKHDSTSDDEHQRSRRRHRYDSSSDDEHRHSSKQRHREERLSDHKRRHSRRSNKHYSSSDDEHRHRSRRVKHDSRSHAERETEVEEGEIIMKSEKSAVSGSREASAGLSNARAPSQSPEVTDVSDELRAKIRAMLMANL
ncbi:unnamed protein product [Sphenostylis stenocarpa]|uniref:SURP motif domain-containing protein n=1 Tax=Sphenostylis stenocarpa TaxID=92480 RepID=A0AA86SZG4_9FABA|nr:unnamed protein product [Sphenostylis stenocarpa]